MVTGGDLTDGFGTRAAVALYLYASGRPAEGDGAGLGKRAMISLDRRSRWMAVCFSGVAGFVDAVGFLTSGGYFVSFMSGNSTLFSVGMVQGRMGVGLAGLLIASFVFGVVAGSSLGRISARWRRTIILCAVTALLALALMLHLVGAGLWATLPLAMAMGAENTVFGEDGDVRVGLTYMTGALVKMGKRITVALFGGDRWGWVPFLLLWLGLAVGAGLGALAYQFMGPLALAAAVAAMGAMTLLSLRTDLRRQSTSSR